MFNFYFNFRMNDETRRELIFLSKYLRRTKSNLLRWLIHEECIRQGYELFDDADVAQTAKTSEGVDDD